MKQTTMGTFFNKEGKDKEKKEKNETGGSNITVDRRTRFSKTSAGENSSHWMNWTDWKKRDTEDYRNGYPGKKDNPRDNDNWKFYNNEIKSYPDGDYIDSIHKNWFGKYALLEKHHGYIQWLFPIRESGMNFHAQELQLHEAQKIRDDPKAYRRVLKSYKLMLDFYGMKMKDEVTGELEKSENWKDRFQNLNRSFHNYLRITRILKCLGELGYEHIKVRFLEFVIEEALEKKTLKNCVESCKSYWVETLRNDDERKYIQDYIKKVEEGYESGGDPTEDYNMDDDSQEMKYYQENMEEASQQEKMTEKNQGQTSNKNKMDNDESTLPDTTMSQETGESTEKSSKVNQSDKQKSEESSKVIQSDKQKLEESSNFSQSKKQKSDDKNSDAKKEENAMEVEESNDKEKDPPLDF